MPRETSEWWLTQSQEDLRGLYTDPPLSFAEKYPNVPPPEDRLSLNILAARWASHDLYGEDMPGIAADLLEAGFDTAAMRRLAGETQVNGSSEVEPLVCRMFHELGVRYPLHEGEADFLASRQIAREVIAGLRNAWAAANHIEIVICRWTPANQYLQVICSINDEVGWDIPYRRPISDLNNALMDAYAQLATIEFVDFETGTVSNRDVASSLAWRVAQRR